MFTGEAIGPFDQIRQFAPWNGPKPDDAWDVLQADGVLQFYVWRDLVFESWRNLQVPFWNPYQLAGTPLLANSQSGGLYPPHILMGVLHVPTALAITLLAWFHLFLAGLGTARLVRALGGSELGGVVAGASFALSPFMLSWTALSSVITTVCWIPWCLWAMVKLFGLPEPGQSLSDFNVEAPVRRRSQWKATWLLAACFAMAILGGHLQFVAYAGFAIVLMTAGLSVIRWRMLKEMAAAEGGGTKQARSALPEEGSVVVALLFGVLVAAPQLLAVLKHSETSHRRNVPSEAGYEAYIGSAIKPFEFANLVTPKALGDPRTSVGLTETMSVAEYWPPLAKQGANFAESAVTVGPLIVGLLFLAPWRDRRTWPIAIIGGLALLLAMGTILNKALYFWLPGWSSTGSPGRIIVLFVLTSCVLAGLAVREINKRQATIAVIAASLIALLTVTMLPGMKPAWQPGMEQIGKAVSEVAGAGTIPALLVSIVVAGGIFLLLPKSEKPGSVDLKLLLPAVPILFAFVGYLTLLPTGKPLATVEGPSDPHARVAIVNSDWGIIAAAPNVLLPPNTAALSRIHEAGGYDSLMTRKAKDRTSAASNGDSAPPANGNIAFIKPTADWEGLQDLGVSEIWSLRPLDSFPFPHTMRGNMYVYQAYSEKTGSAARLVKEGGDPGKTPPGAKVVAEDFQSVTVEVSQAGRYLLSDSLEQGWTATIDGNSVPLLPDNWVEVPEGGKQVKFSYVAPGYSTGLWLGIGALLIVMVGLVTCNRKVEPSVVA